MIKLKNVNKYYNKKKPNEIHVINNASLELPDKGIVAIFGKSGCGKTTFLNAIGGLDNYSSGEITINEQLVNRKNIDSIRNEQIGYIFQNYNLDSNISVKENVASSLKLCGVFDQKLIDERIQKALVAVGMEKYLNRLPTALSGGQQQRVAIARAIVKSPQIVIADEPTGNLDEQNTIMIMDLLKEIAKDRLVLLVTHEEKIVEYYCNLIIDVVDGKIEKVRENELLGEYTYNDNNKIYLGELERKTIECGNVVFDLFGNDELNEKVNIKVVSSNGKIYLQTDNKNIKVVGSSNEIKLFEGKKPNKNEVAAEKSLDFGAPFDVNKKKIGKLFRTKKSIVEGYQVNFGDGRLGKKMLSASLFLLTAIIVFVVANFGTVINQKQCVTERFSRNQFAVVLHSQEEINQALALKDKGSILSVDVKYKHDTKYYASDGDAFAFPFLQINEKMTINAGFDTPISAKTSIHYIQQNAENLKDYKLLLGKSLPISPNEIVITKGVADEIIKNATLDHIKSYEQVLNMSILKYRIVGIVDENAVFVFFEEKTFYASLLLYNYNIVALSLSLYNNPLADNEIILPTEEYHGKMYSIGDKYTIKTSTYSVDFVIKGFLQKAEKNNFLSTGMPPFHYDEDIYREADAIVNDKMAMSFVNKYPVEESGRFDNTVCAYFYAKNPTEARAMLKKTFGKESVKDFDSFIATPLKEVNKESLTKAIVLLATVILLSVCLYLIMRANTIKRIKEIGIYRAIGVTSKNVIFRFWIEGMVIFVCTILIAFVLVSMLIGGLAMLGEIALSLIYYPAWLAIMTLIGIFIVSTTCSILPVFSILLKTPAEILAKYDI